MVQLAGENAEEYWEARSVKGIDATYPWVIFAIRPELGKRHRAYIRSESSPDSVEPAWYEAILPPEACDLFEPPRMYPVGLAEFRDGAHLSMTLVYRDDPKASFTWIINSDGQIVEYLENDDYKRSSVSPKREAFGLGPLQRVVQD